MRRGDVGGAVDGLGGAGVELDLVAVGGQDGRLAVQDGLLQLHNEAVQNPGDVAGAKGDSGGGGENVGTPHWVR